MNFNSFTLKNTKKKAKVLDDRPFNSIANINQGKQRIINSVNLEKTAKWVNCTYVANESDNEYSDHNFKSFNHYFEEPIYSEPDLNKVPIRSEDDDDPVYDMLSITQGSYHCKPPSTDSDYESFSVDKAEIYCPAGKDLCMANQNQVYTTHFYILVTQKMKVMMIYHT